MDFSIRRKDLFDGINIVSRAVPARPSLPILACILVTAGETSIRLTASNLELFIETGDIAADVKNIGSIALDGGMFSSIIKKLDGDTVSITLNANSRVSIKCGKSEYKIAHEDSSYFPVLPTIEKLAAIELSQGKLKEAIKRTLFSVSAAEHKPALTGELFELIGDSLNIVASDGFRIAYRKLHTGLNALDNQFIIPGKALTEVQKLLSSDEAENIMVCPDKDYILFKTSNYTLISILIESKFLNYSNHLRRANETSKTSVIVNRDSLIEGIERANLIETERNKLHISLKFNISNISIFADAGYATCYEIVDIDELQGESELELNFNPRYLLESLNAIEDSTVQINLGNPIDPAVILPADGKDTYRHLILPLNISARQKGVRA